MKNTLILVLLAFALSASAQQDSIQLPPYKRFPTLPPLQLLLSDSTSKYSKDNLPASKPVMIMMFSPDCEHCQHEAEELVKNKEAFKNIQVVMATTSPLWKMKQFISDYKLSEVPGLVVGKDMYYLLPPFYDMRNFPYLAFYNKKGELISSFEGSMAMESILLIFKANN
jgi:thiol-disulfide isomerase/thioredoxin